MKLILRTIIALVLFTLAATALAAESGFQPLTPITQLFPENNSGSIGDFLNTIFQFGIGLAALLAVIMIMWGGFQYMTTDFLGKKQEGRERIKGALYGLLLILGTYLILYTINPAIVSFNLFGGATTQPGSAPSQTRIINNVPTTIVSRAACELLEDDGSYQGRRYYVATIDECQRTCIGRCTLVTADTLSAPGAPGALPDTSDQQLFQDLNRTTCTRIQTYENENGEPQTSVETIQYASSEECNRSCPAGGQTAYCTSGGF